jgi:hypothetical protein
METYIVRVWGSGTASAEVRAESSVRGVVRRVRSGDEARFESWDELRGILSGPVGEPTPRLPARDPDA